MSNYKVLNKNSISCFRTKMCNSYVSGTCKFTAAKCLYSHCPICTRRCPFYLSDTSFIRYIPVLCKNIVFGPNFEVIAFNCPYGNDCIYSHCLDELLYHPNFYKTIACKDLLEGSCKNPFCPFVHKKSEQRALKHYKVPFSKGIEIPPIKYITLVNRMIHSKGNSEFSKRHAILPKHENLSTSCSSTLKDDFEIEEENDITT
ncbi:hypothetical protein BgAZ_208010 [Babesia gibsoni]|uniref:C3H1-type domain-containing protein n=1 Tax=Babesia gibsoni TaxID=33632 RepID=A0AAD8PEL8_BABGI|nr:hypothetical protein BgAZ_208010 [Babesia gibsoni]